MLVTRGTNISRQSPAFQKRTVQCEIQKQCKVLRGTYKVATEARGEAHQRGGGLPGTDLTSSEKEQEDFTKGSIF